MTKPQVLGVVGATASGKSALALQLARAFKGEIICMDAFQVYKGLDIGTAKPSLKERAEIPHLMIDIAEADASYSVAQYALDATKAIEEVLSRGKTPILCGGTGLYLSALSCPRGYGHTPGDPDLRARYAQIASVQGPEALHALLMERDQESARRLHPNDVRRVIRALEVLELSGERLSSQRDKPESPWQMRLFAIEWPRETLYARVEKRADQMMEQGLLDELRALLQSGLPENAQSLQALGYKELIPVLKGEEKLETALALIKQRTRQYAKRQLTWFRPDERIIRLEGEGDCFKQALIHLKEGL